MKSFGKFRLFLCHLPAAIALCGIAFGIVGAWAEPPRSADTGTLDGKLTDTHSLPLAQAVVVVRNLATGATMQGVTGKNGSYRFSGLGPGEYRIEAELPELGKGAVDGILISAGHATRVQAALVMELPSQSLPLSVHEIDPIAPAVTTMIPSEELSAIPLRTRDWTEFAALTPQAKSSHENQSDDGTELGGEAFPVEARARQTASIDGIPGTPTFNRSSNRQAESMGESAIADVQARSSNLTADAGPYSEEPVQLKTSHGGNGLHGQAFYRNRQSIWGAQNPFTQWLQQTAPASGVQIAQFTGEPYTPAYNRQTFGLGLGSQIKRDRLFWFTALDGLASNDPAVATVRHPTDFFAQPTNDELTVLAARLGLTSPTFLEDAASDYSASLNQLAGLLGLAPRTSNQWQGFGRLDWHASERHNLSLEGEAANVDAPGGAATRSSETYGSHSFGNSQASDLWGLSKLESFVTANLLNSAGVQFRRHVQSDTPQTPSAFETPLMANSWGQLPEIVTDSRSGFILGKPARLSKSSYPDERGFVAQDMLSWAHGTHLVKAGASFDHIYDAVGALLNQTGTYSYASVLNFVSDTASFLEYGFNGVDNPTTTQHNCDATGRVYNRGGQGNLGGLGYLPCYAWYSQRIGPADWHVSSNDLAAFLTEQWQPTRKLTLSAGVRLETQQLPPTIAQVDNPQLPATEKLPSATLNWGPRFGLAFAPWQGTVLRIGAGLYYGRINNSVLLAALTQTGSANGDLNFFFRPTDAGAPPFPYVFSASPQTVVTPGAVAFASNFRPQEVDQGVFSIEQELPSHWLFSVSAQASLGRRLPISLDTNIVPALDSNGDPQTITYAVVDALQAGPIKTQQITVPFYTARLSPGYQQIASIESRANSTYDAAVVKLVRSSSRGLSLRLHYIYAHATDWNPNESSQVASSDILDPRDFSLEYGTSNLDIRHSAGATLIYQTPWRLHNWAGSLANYWSIATVAQYRSGLPFTMRTGGYIPGFYNDTGSLIQGIGPGINGSGGDNRLYGIGRNTYRYPATYTGDARLGKRFHLSEHRELELLAESFNLFNHQNVTLIETTGYTIERGTTSGDLPTLNFLTGLTRAGLPSEIPEFGKPLDINATNFSRPREIQLGVRTRF
jgi:hypothetical protein